MSKDFNPYAEHFGHQDDQEQPEDDEAFEMDGDWEVITLSASGKAIRVRDEDAQEYWIPLSQVTPFSQCREVGDSGMLSVTSYLAKARGWS